MSASSGWGHSDKGRRPGFSLTAVELLDKAENYERSAAEPTQRDFLRVSQIHAKQTTTGETLSERQFRTWIHGYGMDYPIVPLVDDQQRAVVVFLADTDGPSTLRWISSNVSDVLGYDRAELIGCPSAEALNAGRDIVRDDPQLCAEFAAMKAGTLSHSSPPPTRMVHRDGHLIDVRLRAGYGKRSRCFYVQATVLNSTPVAVNGHFSLTVDDYVRDYLPDYVLPGSRTTNVETFNVHPNVVIKPPALTVRRSVQGLSIGRGRINGQVINGTLTHTIVKPVPGELERYMSELAEAHLQEKDASDE